jgi:hypothetical protein
LLSPAERAHFDAFGFIVLRGALTAAEVRRIEEESLRCLEVAYEHAPFDGTVRYWTGTNGPGSPCLASLIEDARFWGVAEELLGEHAVGGRCDASRCSQDTIWHPDTVSARARLAGVQFGIYLQPVGAGSGALRVIPGSHREPLHEQVDRYLNAARPAIAEVPALALATRPGDVVCYDISLWHAVACGFEDRRFCNLTYYHLPPVPEVDAVARAQDLLNRRFVREMARPELEAAARAGAVRPFHPHEALFDPHWVENHEGSALRARWLGRLRALGFLDDMALPDQPIELPHA